MKNISCAIAIVFRAVATQVSRILLKPNATIACESINWWHWCRCSMTPNHDTDHEYFRLDRFGRTRTHVIWTGRGPGACMHYYYPSPDQPESAPTGNSSPVSRDQH